MPKIDLRQLLNNTLVANSNEPVHTDRADDSAIAAPAPHPDATQRRDTAPPRPHAPARAAPAVRPHRALRPRRRS